MLLVEPVIVRSMFRNHSLAVKWLITRWSSPTSGLNFSCLASFDISRQSTSSNTISMSANAKKNPQNFSCLASFDISRQSTSSNTISMSANAKKPYSAAISDFRSLAFTGSSSRFEAAISISNPMPSVIKINIAYTNCELVACLHSLVMM